MQGFDAADQANSLGFGLGPARCERSSRKSSQGKSVFPLASGRLGRPGKEEEEPEKEGDDADGAARG